MHKLSRKYHISVDGLKKSRKHVNLSRNINAFSGVENIRGISQLLKRSVKKDKIAESKNINKKELSLHMYRFSRRQFFNHRFDI